MDDLKWLYKLFEINLFRKKCSMIIICESSTKYGNMLESMHALQPHIKQKCWYFPFDLHKKLFYTKVFVNENSSWFCCSAAHGKILYSLCVCSLETETTTNRPVYFDWLRKPSSLVLLATHLILTFVVRIIRPKTWQRPSPAWVNGGWAIEVTTSVKIQQKGRPK